MNEQLREQIRLGAAREARLVALLREQHALAEQLARALAVAQGRPAAESYLVAGSDARMAFYHYRATLRQLEIPE